MFVDSVSIKVQAGQGGDGLTSFRHEKFINKGGPDGGDGGRGGSVILVADHNQNSLVAFRHSPLLKAEDGDDGGRAKRHGKAGADQVVKVPVGTSVLAGERLLSDLVASGDEVVVARGGRGGFGNAHFTSSTRQAPRVAELGEAGEAEDISLELKLIADVGLVGLPNAGKSTFLSVVSNAKPEIADYPFTTLTPHLGVVDIDSSSLLMADIPGLIEGASKGKGLGDDFLRHIERTMVLLHLIDIRDEDVTKSYKTIQKELKEYRVNLATKPQLILLTKVDGVEPKVIKAKQAQLKKVTRDVIFPISAVAHTDLSKVLRATIKLQKKESRRLEKAKPSAKEIPVIRLADDPNAWWIEKDKKAFVVRGQKIEGFARRTNLAQREGERRLRDIMRKMGIDRELVRLDVKLGDTVKIATKKITW